MAGTMSLLLLHARTERSTSAASIVVMVAGRVPSIAPRRRHRRRHRSSIVGTSCARRSSVPSVVTTDRGRVQLVGGVQS